MIDREEIRHENQTDGYRTFEERAFWNNRQMVRHFSGKPPDALIQERLLQIPDAHSKKALDLGCGGGRHTILLCQLGFDTYACDINEEMLGCTKRLLRRSGFESSSRKTIACNILDLPYPDDFFDVTVASGVLHQAKSLSDYRLAVANLARVTKTDGVICLNIFIKGYVDPSFVKVKDEEHTYVTKEGVWMTLLPKRLFYRLMAENRLILEAELTEATKLVNTGLRTTLKSDFIKT